MYVAAKGGEKAIAHAHRLLERKRRGDPDVPELSVAQIREQLRAAVDRVMAEGSLCDPELAALAIKQAQGDLIEAAFLLRAYRATLPRIACSVPVSTHSMLVQRRISATYKDLPGGQVLGATFDYSHRLLDFSLLASAQDLSDGPSQESRQPEASPAEADVPVPPEDGQIASGSQAMPTVVAMLNRDGLIEQEFQPDGALPVGDLTCEALKFPAARDLRLQNLARADEGFLLSLGYSTQRGFGSTHPFVGEIRIGDLMVEITPPELGFPIPIGRLPFTECQMVNQFKGSTTELPCFTRGYGLVFGHNERKAMSMALVDRALRGRELGEEVTAPARDEEFVLMHSDNVQATGFVEHLKLPHHVDFQAELEQIRKMRAQHSADGTIASGEAAE
ncbi:MAG: carbon-phosphorus lyase complex subunit PhnI [Bryobacterales bacterium]|jgi:alpha-D-ribose 1-methylphosphonate 5-triphosphate synthase subunit PhnI|nr:carbon-phosphorus lyase complex subunit PhnI [Bryobacterales bacterium]